MTGGKYFTCALDDSGVKCWGDNSSKQIEVPSEIGKNFFSSIPLHQIFSNPSKFLTESSDYFPKHKANFLSHSATLAPSSLPKKENNSIAFNSKPHLSTLAIYFLTLPIFQETASEHIQSKFLPKFTKELSTLASELETPTLNDIPPFPKIIYSLLSLSAEALLSANHYIASIVTGKQIGRAHV